MIGKTLKNFGAAGVRFWHRSSSHKSGVPERLLYGLAALVGDIEQCRLDLFNKMLDARQMIGE